MPAYRILDDIPLPARGKAGPRGSAWEFETMKVGQCIEVDWGPESTPLRAAANYFKARNPGWTYASKTQVVNGKKVVRVWRTA